MSKEHAKVYVELLKAFDKSGFAERQILVDLVKGHGDNVVYDAADTGSLPKIDEGFLKRIDTMLAEVIGHARAIRMRLHRDARWYGYPVEEVELGCGYGSVAKMSAFVEISPLAIGVGFKGYGVCNMEPDADVVVVEHAVGTPRVIIWGDINAEDATHTVELSGAAKSKRREG